MPRPSLEGSRGRDVSQLEAMLMSTWDALSGSIPITVSGTLSVGTVPGVLVPPPAQFAQIDLAIATPSTGAPVIVDLLVSSAGTGPFVSLWANNPSLRPTIQPGGAGTTVTTFPGITAIGQNDTIQIQILQVGSIVAGANLTVTLGYGPF